MDCLEWFYWNRETVTNKSCKIARGKQKKTIELVHNSAYNSTTYFTVQVKSLYYHSIMILVRNIVGCVF